MPPSAFEVSSPDGCGGFNYGRHPILQCLAVIMKVSFTFDCPYTHVHAPNIMPQRNDERFYSLTALLGRKLLFPINCKVREPFIIKSRSNLETGKYLISYHSLHYAKK